MNKAPTRGRARRVAGAPEIDHGDAAHEAMMIRKEVEMDPSRLHRISVEAREFRKNIPIMGEIHEWLNSLPGVEGGIPGDNILKVLLRQAKQYHQRTLDIEDLRRDLVKANNQIRDRDETIARLRQQNDVQRRNIEAYQAATVKALPQSVVVKTTSDGAKSKIGQGGDASNAQFTPERRGISEDQKLQDFANVLRAGLTRPTVRGKNRF